MTALRHAAGALAVLAPTFAARLATAGDPPQLTYEASPGCPDVAAFTARIERRTAALHHPGTASLSIVLHLLDGRATGVLDVVAPHGERSTRSLTAASCAEVADALALMAALAVDPIADASAGASSNASVPSPPLVAPPAPPPPEPPLLPAPARVAPPSSAPRPAIASGVSEASTQATRPPLDGSRSWRLSLGGAADASWGVTPEVLFAPRVFVDATRAFRGPLGVSLRAGFERGSRDSVPAGSAAASFTWTIGTLDGCPVQWTYATFVARPCARVEGGELDGSGIIVNAHDVPRGWLAVAALGRLRWTPYGPFSVELEGGARAPLIRDQFVFTPHDLIYQPPVVSGLVNAGLLVTFW